MKKIKKCFKYILFLVMILSINKVYAETVVKVNNKEVGLENVYLKIAKKSKLELHLDTDDSNAFNLKTGERIEIIDIEK